MDRHLLGPAEKRNRGKTVPFYLRRSRQVYASSVVFFFLLLLSFCSKYSYCTMLYASANNLSRVWINNQIFYNQKIPFPCRPQVQLGPNLFRSYVTFNKVIFFPLCFVASQKMPLSYFVSASSTSVLLGSQQNGFSRLRYSRPIPI